MLEFQKSLFSTPYSGVLVSVPGDVRHSPPIYLLPA